MMGSKSFLSTPSARRATSLGLTDTINTQISIHALREEGDHGIHTSHLTSHPFLSTPSARRATGDDLLHLCCLAHISIHALREEGDCAEIGMSAAKGQFLSTPSARRATSLKV